MKLALGTVQFGLEYGIANRSGRVSLADATSIVRRARASGIDTLDTAMAYGDAERRLGEIGVADWHVVSKLPAIPDPCDDVMGWVLSALRDSMVRLQVTRLEGLLLHRPDQLLGSRGPLLYEALQQLKHLGLVEKIGVSIYDPAELDRLCGSFQLDLVQAPFNLLDRRLIETGWMHRLAEQQTELHVRSVFLQGLLLMPSHRRPATFARWSSLFSALDVWLLQEGMTPPAACLRDATSFAGISRVVIGVDSVPQLVEALDAAEGPAPTLPDQLRTSDPDLLNPDRWTSSAAQTR